MTSNVDPSGIGMYGIDLRQEFLDIMRKHGVWGLLRKRLGSTKGHTFNPNTGEAIPGDSTLASGEASVDYLVRYRRTGLFDVPESQSSQGREGAALVRFYLEWDKKPDIHDYIAELSQDESTWPSGQIQPTTPFQITRLWDIQEVTPMREHGGRVEFWHLLCKEAVLGGPA